jgi:hypothetical protein
VAMKIKQNKVRPIELTGTICSQQLRIKRNEVRGCCLIKNRNNVLDGRWYGSMQGNLYGANDGALYGVKTDGDENITDKTSPIELTGTTCV